MSVLLHFCVSLSVLIRRSPHPLTGPRWMSGQCPPGCHKLRLTKQNTKASGTSLEVRGRGASFGLSGLAILESHLCCWLYAFAFYVERGKTKRCFAFLIRYHSFAALNWNGCDGGTTCLFFGSARSIPFLLSGFTQSRYEFHPRKG